MELLIEAAQGDSNDVAVVELGPKACGADLQPQTVKKIDVFGPHSRGVRTQIEVLILIYPGIQNLQGHLRARKR